MQLSEGVDYNDATLVQPNKFLSSPIQEQWA